MFTIDPSVATPTNAGSYAGNTRLFISATGTVNLNGPFGQIVTNSDGSLSKVPSSSCDDCWAPGYQYFIPGASTYPTIAGGDGINHFAGGGGNFDMPQVGTVLGRAKGNQPRTQNPFYAVFLMDACHRNKKK